MSINSVDSTGNPTGQTFPTATTDDLGDFSATFSYRGYAALSAEGYYFNEVESALSGSTLSLRGYADFDNGGAQQANINCVTTLTSGRIATLLGQGETLTEAMQQAEGELGRGLAIGGAGYDAGAQANQLGLLNGSAAGRAYALAFGAVAVEVGHLSSQSGSVDAKIQEFLNSTASELATSGTFGASTQATVATAQGCVEPEAVMQALGGRFSAVDAGVPVPDINLALDSDLDGIPNATDNCPLVFNPSQNPINGLCQYRHAVPWSGSPAAVSPFALGDVDGVHGLDAIFSSGPSAVQVVLNDGAANFGAPIASADLFDFEGGAYLIGSAAVGDVDRDSLADLVVVIEDTSFIDHVMFAKGDGAGHFGAAAELFTFNGSYVTPRLVLADLNGDSRLDVITQLPGSMGVALAPSTGPWSSFVAYTVDGSPVQPPDVYAVGDVNGDGHPDITVGTRAGLYVLTSDVNASFTTHGPDTSSGTYIRDISLGDVDGDGFVDTVVSSAPSLEEPANTIAVRFGNATLTPAAIANLTNFAPASYSCTLASHIGGCSGSCGLPFALGDVTGDGKQDLYVSWQDALFVSQGRTFAAPVAPQPFPNLAAYAHLFTGGPVLLQDMNGDSTADLVTVNGYFVVTLFNPSDFHGW